MHINEPSKGKELWVRYHLFAKDTVTSQMPHHRITIQALERKKNKRNASGPFMILPVSPLLFTKVCLKNAARDAR